MIRRKVFWTSESTISDAQPPETEPDIQSVNGGSLNEKPCFKNQITSQENEGLLVEYSSNSTVHGMRYVFDQRRHWLERLWWFIALLVSLLACGHFIYEMYIKWDETPVIVTFSEKSTPVWEIPFPAVTICPETKAARTVANYTDIFLKLKESNFEPPFNVSDEKLTQFQILAQVCINFHFGNLTENENFTSQIVEQLSLMAIPMDETFSNCHFRRQNFGCESLFEKVITEEGQCYTFNSLTSSEFYHNSSIDFSNETEGKKIKNWHPDTGYTDTNPQKRNQLYPVRVLGPGSQHGLRIGLVQTNSDLDYTCRFPVQGFRFLLHEPGEFPQMSEYFMRIPLGQEVLVVVKPNMITTAKALRNYDPLRRQCYYNSDRKLKFFKVYTQRNCNLECLATLTLANCKCVRLGYPRNIDTPICGPSQFECYTDAKDTLTRNNVISAKNTNGSMCNCLPACTSITYDAEISQASVDWKKTYQSFEIETDFYDRYTQSEVTIYFKDFLFTTARRSELFGYLDFVANCGGLLGLFMGVSLLSIVEICYYCTMRAVCNWRSRQEHQPPKIGPQIDK